MNIEVKQEHIRAAASTPYWCPAAIAVREAMPGWEAEVYDGVVTVWQGERKMEAHYPDHMKDWDEDFDIGNEVQPTRFELDLKPAY